MSAAVVLAAACGGESRRTVAEREVSDSGAGAGAYADADPVSDAGVSADGGPRADAGAEPVLDAGPPVINPLPDCVPQDLGGGANDASECPRVSITIDPGSLEPVCAPGGITVEPLQVPELPRPGESNADPSVEDDPAKWDRSERPAGAYVVRLHGLRSSCYPVGGTFWSATCDVGTMVRSQSFYEQHCSVAPGCPTASANPDPTASGIGAWWYLAARGDRAVDLVVCAPLLWNYVYGGCLMLGPDGRCSGP